MTLIYLIAGEQSGDVLGARLIAALRRRRPDLMFTGVGGPRMAELGFKSVFPMHELAVMGLLEVLPRIRRLRRLMQETIADLKARRPDVLVTIDSPGFTLRVLKQVPELKRVHYVAPQVWAWRPKRVKHFPGLWDRLLCLLPFEPAWFAERGLEGRFVGHPVLESGAGQGDGARFRARHRIAEGAPVLILMPGSRRSEVPRLLPVFGETLSLLKAQIHDLVPVVPVASAVADAVRHATDSWPVRPIIVTEIDDKHDAYAAAGAALTKSGTSTLELALAGVPMAVTYRVNPISAAMARRMIRIPHVAMVNLLAGRRLVPELLQHDCRPDRLAAMVMELLGSRDLAGAQRQGFAEVIARLAVTQGLPSDAAADEILALIEVSQV
jgi:lipid-A-disaccharide synthase